MVKNLGIHGYRRGGHAKMGMAVSLPGSRQAVPLCVDLDGTLVNTNTLHETFLAVFGNIRALLAIPGWLIAGKARLKHELALRADFNPALLPYNEQLIIYLREQNRAGRRIILCTAADQSLAAAVSAHLGIFDEVLASHDDWNLRGAVKTQALVDRFGSGGFSYAGNDRTDLAVWREAKSAILVNTSQKVAMAATALSQSNYALTDHTALGGCC